LPLDILAKRFLTQKNDGEAKFRNSAVLLFSKNPEKYIPSSYIRYVQYD